MGRPNVEKDIFGREAVYLISENQSKRQNQAHWAVACKYCGGENVVRFGTHKGAQRFAHAPTVLPPEAECTRGYV